MFGVIGYGRFGKLWADALSAFGEVCVYDKKQINVSSNSAIKIGDLAEVAKAKIIFILTPISHFESACISLHQFVKNDSIILDCCSVKMYPSEIMQRIFCGWDGVSNPRHEMQQPLMATHPLFGPDSVRKSGGLNQHKIVLCPLTASQDQIDLLVNLFKQMGLNIIITTPDEHDKQMATSQGLVHFIGRGLAELNIKPQALATPDFQSLLNIDSMVVNDTWQLFLDMQRYNPYTKLMRTNFMQALSRINKEIEDESND